MPELDTGYRKIIISAIGAILIAILTAFAPWLGLSDMHLAAGITGITTITGTLLAANTASKFAAAMGGKAHNAPVDNRRNDG